MPNEFTTLLISFLACLARVAGMLSMTPVPGWRTAPKTVRVGLSLVLTIAMYPVWMRFNAQGMYSPVLLFVSEAAIGVVLSLAIGTLVECFTLAAQILGLQAGFAYASTIDPNSEADSGILQVMLQLLAGLLFVSLGYDREVVRAIGASLVAIPPGSWPTEFLKVDRIIKVGAEMWKVALRIALPVVTVLLVLDIALALMSRLQSQLQLLSLAFPLKVLVTLLLLGALLPGMAEVCRQSGAAWLSFMLQ